ncbi:MAG: ACP S-malonyltransferase [Bacteroidota bacterium]
MRAYIFPGQGAQFEGMGNDLYASSDKAKTLFEQANEILGFRITDVMFEGTKEDLKQTKVTQPAIFLHSVITSILKAENFNPDVVAGHSLGEFSALTAAGILNFEDGLKLVSERALAMQAACEEQESTMAAILGLDDGVVEDICDKIEDIVVPANYNCPGQLVISGSITGVEKACEALKEAGARRALILPVGGAFHSPLMEPARERLENAINQTTFNESSTPIYQNVTAAATTDPAAIKTNLILQLTAPVKWTQTLKNMLADGVDHFTEVGGTGRVLQGMVKKVDRSIPTETL